MAEEPGTARPPRPGRGGGTEPRRLRAVRILRGSARPSLAQPRPRSNRAPLPQLQPYVDRALCTLRLVRAHCRHYRSPARAIVVLQEICNLLIEMVELRGRRQLRHGATTISSSPTTAGPAMRG